MERPKYLEYRHRRDQIVRYTVARQVKTTLEKPASALLRLVGKKMKATRDTYSELWEMELRVSDVRPDWSGIVKSQVTSAQRFVQGEESTYAGLSDPTTEFLSETVDRYGNLTELAGTLPTPHLVLFPEDPMSTGQEWTSSRMEILPKCGLDGKVSGYEPMEVIYRGRVDAYGDDGTEFADIAISASGARGTEDDPVRQEYEVSGNVRFAIRDGHTISAKVTRTLKSFFDVYVVTSESVEEFKHASQETEKSVGGMRL
jgi:hypothetical protein